MPKLSSLENGKHCNFTLLFCRGWHGLVHMCVPHVQHAYIFLTRPIKLFICGVVVAVPFVDAKAPYDGALSNTTSMEART